MIIPQDIIENAKGKLGDEAALIIAKDLELENFDEKNLKACCHWHKEDTPSLVWNSRNHYFKCFGCGRVYGIVDHYISQGLTYLGALEKLFEQTKTKFKFGERNVKTKREYKYPHHEQNPTRDDVEKYIEVRRISKATLDYCDIQEDVHGNIVFHYYDTNDVLTLVKYRPSKKVAHGEIKAWCQKDADTTPVLFNMNRIDPSQSLVICEGEIDCLSVIEAGYKNAVSIPLGAGNEQWIECNWEWLEQFTKIIVWSDADDAGKKMKRSVIPRLGEWRCYEVEAPLEAEINGKTIPIKDINEVLYFYGKEKVLECIFSAKEMPITNIVDLANVQDFDME